MALIAAKKKSSGTRKELPKKKCPVCKKEKSIAKGFYKSASPLYAEEGCVPMCIDCVKDSVVNEDGTISVKKLKSVCRKLDKPLYFDALESAYAQYRREHSYVPEEEIARQGRDIIALFFKNTASLRQYQNKNYEDSEKDNFIIQGNSTSKADKEMLLKKYNGLLESHPDNIDTSPSPTTPPVPVDTLDEGEELIYDEKWMGNYTQKDIDYLNKYYSGLERDYKIITENHRDYARKIAKASLQMDKAFDEMINGVEGADARYKNAREAFDTLSKSAKFSESTRSVNDVGISSFSKVAAMVEAHNWIPEHKPLKKDVIDEMIDYLSTITKSL